MFAGACRPLNVVTKLDKTQALACGTQGLLQEVEARGENPDMFIESGSVVCENQTDSHRGDGSSQDPRPCHVFSGDRHDWETIAAVSRTTSLCF